MLLTLSAKSIFFSSMTHSRHFTISAAILAILLFAESAKSQALISSPQPLGGLSLIRLQGSFGEERYTSFTGSNVRSSLDLDLASATNTVTFLNTILELNETIQLSGDFEVGGETVTIEGSVTFDSTLDFADDFPVIMTPDGESRFVITDEDFAKFYGGGWEDTASRGSYQFSGPSESVSGTFSHSPGWWHFF